MARIDRKIARVANATLGMDHTDNFEMMLPNEPFFNAIDFKKDRSAEVKAAETNE